MKKRTNVVLVITLCMILSANTCKEKAPESKKCDLIGEVADFTGLDGCGLVLKTKDETYEVVSWPDGYSPKEGDKLSFSVKDVDGASICMVGPIVEVICLEKLN